MKGKFSVVMTASLLFLVLQTARSQGVIYLSNLGETSAGGGLAVGGGNSLAQPFQTGTNAAGYYLNSVQLLMSASGTTANAFGLSLYSDNGGVPGNSFAILSGPGNPTAAGLYAYTASGITLSPSTAYWIVAAAETSFGDFYWWTVENSANYTAADGWSMNATSPYGYIIQNSSLTGNGLAPLQFDVSATPVPEPETSALAGLGLMAGLLKRTFLKRRD